MLDMQDSMNSMINPQWVSAGYAWHRATYVEAVELLEHLGNWKWWKKHATPNIAEAQTELVDIFHFYLSDSMVKNPIGVSRLVLAMDIEGALDELPLAPVDWSDKEIHRLLDKLISMAGAGVTDYRVFFRLMSALGMSFDDMSRRYVGKCLLNRLRATEGYADGSYIKMWGEHEDNVVLDEILKRSSDSDDVSKFIEDALASAYIIVKKNRINK